MYIIEVISGFKIPFLSSVYQSFEPSNPNFNITEDEMISVCIDKLLDTGAIVRSEVESNQFVSTIFTVPKPDGTRRPIINLKHLNKFVETNHFKMENIKTASELVSKNCFMSVIDLKEAYHAIPICLEHQKYLKFRWKGVLYQYTCVPFGLSVAPLTYTKIFKPVVAYLRENDIVIVSYLDDTELIAPTFDLCQRNVKFTINLFESLGFVVNEEKSQLIPSQRVKYLGFIMDSRTMKLTLPADKCAKIIAKCRSVSRNKSFTIQIVAELVGTLIAACPATSYGLLYTRQIEHEKTKALEKSGLDYRAKMSLSLEALLDIEWWINNIEDSYRDLHKGRIDLRITTDASTTGWGCECNGKEAKGIWTELELLKYQHINELELLAIFYGLKTFATSSKVKNILIRTDNTTAMAYINRYGGCRAPKCHEIAKDIWKWCEARGLILRASYINTKANFVADRLSRSQKDSSDFMLSKSYFERIIKVFGSANFDLFASYQTKQCQNYYSWKPDPYSLGVDAFLFKWESGFYCFPPFNLITRVLNKIKDDKCEGVVVVPEWSTQPWFPLYKQLTVSDILILGPNKNLLFDPLSRDSLQINRKLKLMVAKLSGKHY
jgi:ribonuclease HI